MKSNAKNPSRMTLVGVHLDPALQRAFTVTAAARVETRLRPRDDPAILRGHVLRFDPPHQRHDLFGRNACQIAAFCDPVVKVPWPVRGRRGRVTGNEDLNRNTALSLKRL